MKLNKLMAMLLVVLIALSLAACGKKDESAKTAAQKSKTTEANADGQHYKLGFTEWVSCEFFDSVYDGLMSVVNEHGDAVMHSEGQADSSYQLNVIEDFIAQGVDVVFYNPVDTAASQVAVDMMNEAGITIVNFDSQVLNIDDVAAFVGTDNYQAGYLAGKAMMKDFPQGGPVAVLNYPANTAAVDRENGFIEATKGSDLKIVQTLDGEGLTETSTSQMEDILQAHPDLVAVFGINDDSGLGAYAAIMSADMNVKIYAVNGSPAAKEKVAEGGIFTVTVAQSTINMGKQSAEIAYKILNGEKYEHDNLIAPITINKDNVNDYGIDGWQ